MPLAFSYVPVHFKVLQCSGYVIKYFDVKKCAFLRNLIRDFGRLYAYFLFAKHTKNNRFEIRACLENYARFFNLMSENAHRAALTLSLQCRLSIFRNGKCPFLN